MASNVLLHFAGQTIAIEVDGAIERELAPVLAFTQPHFAVESTASAVTGNLSMKVLPLSAWTRPSGVPHRTVVREGRTNSTTVFGDRWAVGSRTVIEIPSSQTVFDLAEDGSELCVYISPSSRYHLSDFLREAMWELAASGGGKFIHAASVSNGRAAVAVVGDKGAGKTTTALDFLRAGADFYSGDILFSYNDASRIFSYPDYPGVCWGTIRANPELLSATRDLGLRESLDDGDKVLLPHDIYSTALGVSKVQPPLPLAAIVIADASAPGAARIERAEPRWDLMESLARRSSPVGEGWEDFLNKAAVRFANRFDQVSGEPLRPGVPWYTRLGRGLPPLIQIQAVLETA